LTPARFDLAEAHVCTRCTGLWFDEAELVAISMAGHRASVEELPPPEFHLCLDEPGACPRCLTGLEGFQREPLGEQTIAGCATCGGLFFHDQALEERHWFRIGTSVDPEAPGEALNVIDDLSSQSDLDRESGRFVLEWIAARRSSPGAPRSLGGLVVLAEK
jgi:Zn-finger nucleic acid-binding protein